MGACGHPRRGDSLRAREGRAVIRILVVNQTSQISGAERSLLELLAAFDRDITVEVACPPGDLAATLRARGHEVHPLQGTDVSFRLHPWHTARGLARIAADARTVRRIGRRMGADIVHANTTRAGLVAVAGRRRGCPPVIVHVRDWVPDGRLAQATLGLLARRATAVLANSEFTAGQLPPGSAARKVAVVHNPVDSARFDPATVDRDGAREAFDLAPGAPVLAVVGQLTPWKGQDDAVRTTALLTKQHPDVRLLVVGSAKFTDSGTRFDNLAYERQLHALVHELGLREHVVFAGEQDDVRCALGAADLLLVPSWKEAFGRVAVEGMAMAVPVLVTAIGGPPELVRDGIEGRVLAPRDPSVWAQAAGELLDDPGLCERMGAAGRARAVEVFAPAEHARRVEAVYRATLQR